MIERLQDYPRLKKGLVVFGGSLAIAGCAAKEAATPPPDTASSRAAQEHASEAAVAQNETEHMMVSLRVSLAQAEREQAARNALRLAKAAPTPAPTKTPAPPPSPTSLPSPHPTHTHIARPRSEAPAVIAIPQNLSANERLAEQMAAGRGWTGQQWVCLDELWNRESHFDASDTNPSSGAYGIPQALPGSKMASAGPDWATNPATQITWGLGYIGDRYGTPCGAEVHSEHYNWY